MSVALRVCATTNTTAATATTIAPRLLLISTNTARAPRARSYIVALRNLNAVVSFAKDGSGIQWLLAADANRNNIGVLVRLKSQHYGTEDYVRLRVLPENFVPLKSQLQINYKEHMRYAAGSW